MVVQHHESRIHFMIIVLNMKENSFFLRSLVIIFGLVIFSQCSKEGSNSNPVASFTVDPVSGSIATNFNFDASGSSDEEDAASSLLVRWDWENDGNWNTTYSSTKTATYKFSAAGTYTVKLEVRDSENATGTTTKTVTVTGSGTVMNQPCPGTPTITYEGRTYNTVLIGSQCWMKENLNVGTMISSTTPQEDNGVVEKFCYNNDPNNCATYGGLYQWSELMQYVTTSGAQGICPPGWHVPTDAEWCTMTTYIDPAVNCTETTYTGNDGGGKLKEAGTDHWIQPNAGATNQSGFKALGSGIRFSPTTTPNFSDLNEFAYFWTSTRVSSQNAVSRALTFNNAQVGRFNTSRNWGAAVRCIKD